MHGQCFMLPATLYDNLVYAKWCNQGSLPEYWCSGFLLGVSYVGMKVPTWLSLAIHFQLILSLFYPKVKLIQCGPDLRHTKTGITIIYIVDINYLVWPKISGIQRNLTGRIFQGLRDYLPEICHRLVLSLECAEFEPPSLKSYPFPAQISWYLTKERVSSINSYRNKRVNEVGNSSLHLKYLVCFKQMTWITDCQGRALSQLWEIKNLAFRTALQL